MAKQIGKLAAIVTADTTRFTRGMKKAQDDVKSFGQRARAGLGSAASTIGKTLAGIGIAAAAAVGAAAVAQGVLIKHSFESIDALAKSADSLNITTEALAGFHHQADLAGASAEEFDGAVAKMIKTTDAAANGSKRALIAFNTLNIDPKKLGLLSTENQIKVIADRLEQIPDPSTRAATAMRIFGGAGLKMTNVLAGGSAALEAGQAEAERFGLAISRIDAAKVEVANDSITRLKAVVTGAAQTIAVQLAPWVAGVAKALTEMGITGQTSGFGIAKVIRFVVIGVAKLWEVVDAGKIVWHGLQYAALKALQGILWPIQKVAESIQGLTVMFGDYLPQAILDGAQAATDAISNARNIIDTMAQGESAAIGSILTAKSAAEEVAEFFDRSEKAARDEAKAIADAAEKKIGAQEKYTQAVADSVAGTAALAKEKKKTEKPREDLKLLTANSAEGQAFVFDTINRRQEDVTEAILEEDKDQTKILEDIAANTEEDDLAPVYF